MESPDTIAIASTLAGSCISHISKVSESRKKRKDDNYRIALHREFGRFRLWLHGFHEPVTGQMIEQSSLNNALDEVLKEATYLKEPTILLLSIFTSCLLSEHLQKVGNDLTRASLKVSLHQTKKIYPHMEKALERQWNTRESVIADISDTIDLLFDLVPPLDDILENMRYSLIPLNGTTELQEDVLVSSNEVVEEDLPEWTIPLADAYCSIYQKYIQDKFPNASPDLDIDRFARGNAKCHDRLLAEPEMPMPSEPEIHIVASASREGLDESLQIGHPAEVHVATTFHDSGLGSSAPTQSINSPSMGESLGGKMPIATILQDPRLESSLPALLNTASAQEDLKGGTFLAPPPSISGLSQSTLCSQSSTPDKRPSLPAIPEHPPYYCKLCRSNLKQMSKRLRGHQWRKHIFSDLQPYMCIRANCSQGDVFLKSKKEWVAHDKMCNQNRHQGPERIQLPAPEQCPFCVKEFGTNKAGFYNHVAHHMEDIRLIALPPSYRDLTDEFQNSSNTGASFSTHNDRDGLPTIAEVSDSQPYDKSIIKRYLKANGKVDKSFVVDWVLGGSSPPHAGGQTVLASSEIQKPIGDSSRVMELYPSVENDQRLKALSWLSKVEYDAHHHHAQQRRQEGTGSWLFGDDTFIKWKDSEANSILWIRGIPGSGKTILASSIIDQFGSLSASNDHAVAYFYCSYKEPDRRDAASILRTLIKQFYVKKEDRNVPTLVDQLYNIREEKGDNGPLNPEEGTELIIALSKKYQSTTLIIDALDECVRGTRESLFSSVHKIIQQAIRVKIVVTSRYDVDNNDSFTSGRCYYIDNKDNYADIHLYIDAELDRRCDPNNVHCGGYDLLLEGNVDPELKALIRSRLQAGSTGTFMWVDSQIVALCAARTVRDVKEVLDRIPGTLDGTYRQIMERIELQDLNSSRVAKIVLKWLLCAQKECTTGSVIQAIAIDPGVPDVNNDGLNRTIPDILRICETLVVHDGALNIFRFAHDSVRELLVQKPAFELQSSNTYVAEVCLTALLYHHENRSSIPELYSYASEYWGDHVRLSGATSGALATLCMDFFRCPMAYSGWGTGLHVVGDKFGILEPGNGGNAPVVEPLLVASYYGLPDLCRLILAGSDNGLNSTTRDGYGPLLLASMYGHDKVVRLLLEREDVDVNSKSASGQTPLSGAARNGHDKVVKLLLEREDVDVNSKSGSGKTPLSGAAGNGHDKVVKLLLEREDVDVNSKGRGGMTSLSWAARNGHDKVVKLLLEREDVDVNSKSGSGKTPLSGAAGNGHDKVVKLLLKKEDVDVNSKDSKNKQSPLSWAAWNGHDKVVKLLLEREDVDVNSESRSGKTPLSGAAGNGHDKIVKLLLEREDVDVNLNSGGGMTPLSCAAGNGSDEVVKLLLEREDVDVNSEDNDGLTALDIAAGQGHTKVEELLQPKAGYHRKLDMDIPDND